MKGMIRKSTSDFGGIYQYGGDKYQVFYIPYTV